MNEEAIATAIKGHHVRNLRLKRDFEKRGVELDDPRSIDFHFLAWAQRDAAVLAKSSYEIGFSSNYWPLFRRTPNRIDGQLRQVQRFQSSRQPDPNSLRGSSASRHRRMLFLTDGGHRFSEWIGKAGHFVQLRCLTESGQRTGSRSLTGLPSKGTDRLTVHVLFHVLPQCAVDNQVDRLSQ
jgi:hypothetical protein